MQTLTALIQIFYSLRGKWTKVNYFRNRGNLFSTTSQIFPQAGEQLTPRSYTVTQLHSVIRFFRCRGIGGVIIFIIYIIL